MISSLAVFCADIGRSPPVLVWKTNLTKWSEQGLLPKEACQSAWSSYQLIADID